MASDGNRLMPVGGDQRMSRGRAMSSTLRKKASKLSKLDNKQATSGVTPPNLSAHSTHTTGVDGRHKRVSRACERCRMKKTRCDLDFPCKRCKDDAIVCTARVRKNVEYKQLPKGYAEVLENTQLALVATIDKLYAMVRNSQAWTFGEPEFNHCGQPVIHNIAETLGCIRPNGDIDLPIHSVFPEDKEGMTELARQLEEEQTQTQPEQQSSRVELDCDAPSYEFEQSSCNVDGISSNFHNRPKLAGDDSSVAMSRHSLVSVATGSGPDRPMAINDDSFSPPQRDEQNPQKCFGLPPSSELGTSHFEYSDDGLDWLNVLHPGLAEGEYAMESDILSMQSLNVIKSDIRSIQIPDLMTSLNDSTVYVGFHSNETRP